MFRLPLEGDSVVDPAVAAVAATAATTLVTAMTTDAWDHTRRGFGRLLGLGGRAGESGGVEVEAEAELEHARETVLTAYERGDAAALGEAHENWAARLGAALEANAHRSAECERLLRELIAGQPGADGEIRALGAALRGSQTHGVYSQVIQSGGAGAQGPGASVTVNNHHHGPGAAQAGIPRGES
ncbi:MULTISPECIES: hypothetical protein [unclassified Streptomyces]|uniref:hypothetical protein n=1 Tax=unclassified Streptomyces TaxID=2593676 RepID=UPI00131D310F|nr:MULTISPECIES: hypothetical protein [unclassified Streptomyces]MDX6761018.1 hypothetical protein [Streptomyces sp. F8]